MMQYTNLNVPSSFSVKDPAINSESMTCYGLPGLRKRHISMNKQHLEKVNSLITGLGQHSSLAL